MKRRRKPFVPLPRLAAILLPCLLCLSALATPLPEPSMRNLINFDHASQEPRWVAVNDGVMGGRSSGGPVVANGLLRFSGELSLQNNGGFSSVRSAGRTFDFSDAATVVLRVRGDGRRYQLRLATDARDRGMSISFGAEFDTDPGQWREVRVPLASLRPTLRGSTVQGAIFDPSRVREIGLLIADKREGTFALEVDWIALE